MATAQKNMSFTQKVYIRLIKGVFDRFFSLIGLVLLAPVFFFIAVAVKINSRGPVFFCHERIGLNGQPFGLYKFRSMVQDASQRGPSVTKGGDPRITPVGRFLRKYKLDELPQLLNVVFGHISLVGPRPEVKEYVDLFWEDYQHILTIKPGITDYAALEFRNEEELLLKYEDLKQGYISYVLPRKIELYKQYLERVGFIEDVRIICKTIRMI